MSIHFISGKPGGGKTLYSVRLVVDELLLSRRTIVTNVSLKLGAINEYMQKEHPRWYEREIIATGRTVADRFILLDEDNLPKFFTYRGNGVRLDSIANDAWKRGERPDYSKVRDEGCFYVLDEVHIAFNARAWAETGAEVLYYLSQHRKLGDDVICITQAVANVDKQFRSVAQDFTYIKNLAKAKWGLFRLPSLFVRQTFGSPQTGVLGEKAMETGTFTMDVTGYASLYDTAKGVGIHGRSGADTKERKRGLPWWVFVVGLIVLIYSMNKFAPKIVVWALSPHQKQSAPASPDRREIPAEKNDSSSAPVQSSLGPDTNQVFCTGYTLWPKPIVFLSDGRIARAEDGDVQNIFRHRVEVFGTNYPVKFSRPDYYPSLPSVSSPYDTPQPSSVSAVSSPPSLPSPSLIVVPDSRRSAPPATGGFNAMSRQNYQAR